jgi:SagB-type dehydrogenase family enzyme
MRQIDPVYLVISGLLLGGLFAVIASFLMDFSSLHQLMWRPEAGPTGAALLGLNLICNWERATASLRRFFKSGLGSKAAASRYGDRMGRREFFISVLAAAGGFVFCRALSRPARGTVQAVSGDPGLIYHQQSQRTVSLVSRLLRGPQPDRYKSYHKSGLLVLPKPESQTGLSVEEAITRRRSKRTYRDEPLSQSELAGLMYAAAGLTDLKRERRAAPSAGALYPIEAYLVVNDVSGVAPGLYHYNVPEHALEQLKPGDLRSEIVTAGVGQEMLGQAAVCVVLSAVFQRTRWKYRERAYRYILLEAGHIGQNLYLSATSLGLGACAVGAFHDDKLNDLLGVDGEEEAALYILAVGKV